MMKGGGVVHSFDGTLEEARAIIEMGLYIGINGCSLRKPENLKVVRSIPASRLLIETDAPWCDIRPTHAGFGFVRSRWPTRPRKKFQIGLCVKSRNEPCHLAQVLEVVAGVRGVESPEALAKQLLKNTEALFPSLTNASMGG
eukprot:g2387.t1